MKVNSYLDAGAFLKDTQEALESNGAVNSLMLGVCQRLARHPEQITIPPCLKAVVDEKGVVLAAMMTPPQKLVVYGRRCGLEVGARLLVEELVGEAWEIPGVLGPQEAARHVVEEWGAVSGTDYHLELQQWVYVLREVKMPVPAHGRLRLAEASDIAWVAPWRYAFHVDIFGAADREAEYRAAESAIARQDMYLWEDKQPVSMAMKTRPTGNGISVSLVYTPPELRGRGFATACVGELSRLLLASGWGYCVLFANVANVTANRVYQKIGYEPVGLYDEYIF
ncbi:MAG: GNAT family N-acetyltransferase [Anaerolineae bacterium]|nr:GNAT family N-acetyltransferase [Anaerolineae bacterium]